MPPIPLNTKYVQNPISVTGKAENFNLNTVRTILLYVENQKIE
jgi:hypothetical protein